MLCLGVLFGVAFVITYWPFFVAAVAFGVFLAARAAIRRQLRALVANERRRMARHVRAVSARPMVERLASTAEVFDPSVRRADPCEALGYGLGLRLGAVRGNWSGQLRR
jgi:hypothetical protein